MLRLWPYPSTARHLLPDHKGPGMNRALSPSLVPARTEHPPAHHPNPRPWKSALQMVMVRKQKPLWTEGR